jgi:hypothetical protein
MGELKVLYICRWLALSLAAAVVIAFLVFLIGGWTYDAPVVGGHWSEPDLVCKSDVGPCGEIAPAWIEEKDYSEAPIYARFSQDIRLYIIGPLIFIMLIGIWVSVEDKITLKEKSLCELPKN